jgi:hypothetical protein
MIVADLTRPDRNEYRQHFKGADAVIHCGFVSAPRLNATSSRDAIGGDRGVSRARLAPDGHRKP